MTIDHFYSLRLLAMQLVIASSSLPFALMGDSIISNNIVFGSTFLKDNKNITVLDYTGDVAIVQFPNGTTYNLNVPKYSECIAYLVMSEGIPRYLVEGPAEEELLTENELGIAEAMNECIGVGVGVSSMEAAMQ